MATRYLTTPEMAAMFGDSLSQIMGVPANPDGTYTMPEGALDQFIEMAEAEADSYIGAAYQLPLASVPPILQQMVADVARWLTYSDGAPAQVQARYDRAIGYFKQLAAGKAVLGVPQAAAAVAPVKSVPTFVAKPSAFRRLRVDHRVLGRVDDDEFI
ncbi:DUF1320 domain-containing protein [Burkholderia pseudomallei]|uniref:DUF1320 domain-containing protein n=1 Tax=Burkholderia pseudomallei TaxID=28450 RepID=UPI000975FD69|nr:DUF1320 domain-containing protein [Burkholderia pseudomallei]OMS07802.1 hypothetical protein AQ736_03375 [Burkholderia pseudomallei]OMS96430.1 hypothetical protein AQ750_04655 [Burkholderia pseudomallei]OMV27163.1 hypothetical protein AQ787_14165 [Burkholderia pseudomallei]CAJ3486382.1 Mu-like prophage protein gp36 [Burkholderia pseudomallei]CAJ4175814.1 Mu-like prophage protein gp36 [Burkholderia pseudomallei]